MGRRKLKMNKLKYVPLLLLVLALFACSAADQPAPEHVGAVAQGVVQDTFMRIQPGEQQMTGTLGHLYQDRLNPSPTLTQVSVLVGLCPGQYSTTTHQAVICTSQANFNAINADLAQCFAPGSKHMWFSLYYDDAGSSTTKAVWSWSYGVSP